MSKHNGKEWATKALALPIDVIVSEYRQAKDPNKMIDILADQCEVKPCRIAWILNLCGLKVASRKMPRALRGEDSFDYVAYWETCEDAVICDRLAAQIRAAQSMPEFDEPEPEETEVKQEREGENVEAKTMFETDSQFIKRIADEYGVEPEEPGGICGGSEEDPPEIEDLIAGLWEVFLQYRAKLGKGALTAADVQHMQALARTARDVEWED